jgi:methionine synthase II (cobalamin-independent)
LRPKKLLWRAISPSNLELYYENRYYDSDEEYLAALADAMHVEYKALSTPVSCCKSTIRTWHAL